MSTKRRNEQREPRNVQLVGERMGGCQKGIALQCNLDTTKILICVTVMAAFAFCPPTKHFGIKYSLIDIAVPCD